MQFSPHSVSLNTPHARWREFFLSFAIYALFAAGVFFVMGPQPLLGSDHLSYMRLADEIAEKRPNGNYLPEVNSVRTFSVMLAWLHHFTGSHVLSMKLVLAAVSVPYLLAADLLLGLFTTGRWKRRLFALLAGFALSFGVASWGITDYTALMPRTLVMPAIFLCSWFYLRFFHRAWRYAVFPVLVLFSILHLSTFHFLGILGLFEGFDFLFLRRRRIDARFFAFPAWLVVTLVLLLALERTGIVVGGTDYLASMIAPSVGSKQSSVSATESAQRTGNLAWLELWAASYPTPGKLTPQWAWQYELANRAWRNMPLPWINVANILSSFSLILLLACAGAWIAFQKFPCELDLIMAWWVPTILLFALGPQTMLWILRQFTGIYPINIEEIRAISFLMIPALYFCLRLSDWLGAQGGPAAIWGRTAVVGLYLVLPLTMKSLTPNVRETLLGAMIRLGIVDSSPTAISNARSALGLSYTMPLYYPVQGLNSWLENHGQFGSLVLTDRDDMLVRSLHFVGSRQEVQLQDAGTAQAAVVLQIYNRLKQALGEHNLGEIIDLARLIKARYVIVPWPVENAAYRDAHFSLIDLRQDAVGRTSK